MTDKKVSTKPIDISKPLQLADGDPSRVVLYTDKGAHRDYPLVGAIITESSVITMEWTITGESKTVGSWNIENRPPLDPYTISLDEKGVTDWLPSELVKVKVDSEGKEVTITVGEDWHVIVNGSYNPNLGSKEKPKGPWRPPQPRGESKSLSEAYFQGVSKKSPTTAHGSLLEALDEMEM